MVRLPSEYQEIEYIKGTGAQWIDTGVIIQNGYGFEVEAKFESDTVSWDDGTIRYICGSRDSYIRNRFTIQSQLPAGGMCVETDSTSRYTIYTGVIPTERHVYQVSNNGIFVDGNLNSSTVLVTGNSLHFLIFNISNNGSNIPTSSEAGVGARFWRGPVYYLKLFETNSGETLHHYIPCYRKSDNKPGMYDLISGQFFTNAGTGEFLIGGEVRYESVEMLHLRRRLLDFGRYVSPHIGEASGNPMTFNTDIARNLHKLVIPFSPVQEGTGDPSPDNVRPISGWTGCEITHRAANLIDINALIVGGISGSDGSDVTGSSYRRTDYIYLTSGTYLFSRAIIGRWCKGFLYSSQNQGSMIRKAFDTASAKQATFTVSEPCYCRIGFDYTPSANDDLHFWEQGTTLPITFTDPSTGNPLTVYGGTVTLNQDRSADLVVTHRYIDVNPNNARLNADKDTMVWAQISLASGYYGASSNRNIYSNIFTNKGYGTIYGSQTSATGNRILVGLPAEYDTTNLVKQFFTDNPTQFVYKLASDQTYHFDNIGQLYTYLGTNTIWTDTNGINSAEYWTHLN